MNTLGEKALWKNYKIKSNSEAASEISLTNGTVAVYCTRFAITTIVSAYGI